MRSPAPPLEWCEQQEHAQILSVQQGMRQKMLGAPVQPALESDREFCADGHVHGMAAARAPAGYAMI
eukprot:6197663-Pleurochrysis_carterae.AAC.1